MFDNEALSINVGERLRQLRERCKLSIRALGRASGLSANALSMIERSRVSPSVSTLYKLADALQVPVTAFFRPTLEADTNAVVFCRATERIRLPFARGLWEGLGGEIFRERVVPFMLTLESGTTSGPFGITHTGHEFVFCLRGQLEYQVETQHFILEPGDSLLFTANLRHRWRNPGKTVTNALIVLSSCLEEGLSQAQKNHAQGMEDGLEEPGDLDAPDEV
jgi:transcriptional regulator with XRE-family HTH domain